MYADEDENLPKGTFEIYKAEADCLYKQGEFRKAIESYSVALELKNKDINCLVARSKCHLHLGDTKNALKDAEASLVDSKSFHRGIYQKAQSLYYQGDFEMALVFYHRGHKLRPELTEFRLGIQKAQEAIDNAVGSPTRVKLSTEGDMSYFKEMEQEQLKRKQQSFQSFTRAGHQQEQKRQERKCTSSEKTVKQLLGELYGDKQYLDKLLKLTGSCSSKGQRISCMAEDGLSYLRSRTDFWRQQNPMYARKQDRQLIRRPINVSASDFIIQEIGTLDKDLIEGRYNDVIKRAQKCIGIIETFSETELSNKFEVVANLHSFMGNAYLENACYTKALKHHKADYEMGKKHKIDDSISRALDNVGRTHARNKEYEKAIAVWEEKLPLSRSLLESTWLYHEIGRCYLECGEFSKAQHFGELSAQTATDADDSMWQLQAHVLIAQSQVRLSNIKCAITSFNKAYEQAKLAGDDSAELAIMRAVEELSGKAFGDAESLVHLEPGSYEEEAEAC